MSRHRYMFKTIRLLCFGALCVAFLLGCSGTEVGNPDSSNPVSNYDLDTFGSDTELEAYLKAQYAGSAVPMAGAVDDITAPDSDWEELDNSVEGGAKNRDYTGTNLQETGVDEADVLKTDGQTLFIAQDQTVTLVTTGDTLQWIASIHTSGTVDDLYLYNDLLVVRYTPPDARGNTWCDMKDDTADMYIGFPCWVPVEQKVGISFYDVKDPAAPTLVKTLEIDGTLVSSRLVNGDLHLVTHFVPALPPMICTYSRDIDAREATVQENAKRIETLTLDELLPFYHDIHPAPGDATDKRLVTTGDIYRPLEADEGGSIVSIVTFDLDNPTASFSSKGVVADARTVYASNQALYIAAERYAFSADLIAPGETYTTIHKFDWVENGVTKSASGRVRGWILNQFSMGEYDATLRIATTTNSAWWANEDQANHVYCLKAEANDLQVVGQVEDIAPGERIYAARFVGERGFLVTFQMVDPLFTLDLSDPTKPSVVGKLKVPGFSDYIHIMDDNHLLTIGKDVINHAGTWQQGVQLSVFDITTFSDPQLLHSVIIGDRGTHSEALNTHKAFTYWRKNNLLAFPVDLYLHQSDPQSPWDYGQYENSSLYVYRVTPTDGFEVLGTIALQENATDDYPPHTWARGVFIADYVYAVTPAMVGRAITGDIDNTLTRLDLSQEKTP